MRTLVFFIMILLAGCNMQSQETTKPYIEVTGSAEMSIIPNQIELEIVIGSVSKLAKSTINDVEKKFFDALEANGIPKSVVSFVSADNPYYWYCWWWETRYAYDTKTFKLNLDCTKYNFSFLKDLGPDFVRSIRITKSSHSEITDYRRQIKIEAIKAAKEKASVLLESIDQKAGKVIEVIELPEQEMNNNYWYGYGGLQNYSSNCIVPQANLDYTSSENSTVPSIKLRFEVKAKFEIL